MNNDFTKSNLLISFNYPKRLNEVARIDIENDIKAELFAIMSRYKIHEKVNHFAIADDDVIAEKIKDNV